MKWFAKRRKRREVPVKATFADRPIRSDYVLNRLRNTRWENHETIFSLIALERYVVEGPHGWIDAIGGGALRQRYPDETRAIEAELLPPDEFAEMERSRAAASRRAIESKAKADADRKEAAEAAKREWLALGGKP